MSKLRFYVKCIFVVSITSLIELACKDDYVQSPTTVTEEKADSSSSREMRYVDIPSSQVSHGLKATFYLTNQAGDTTTRFRVGENIFFHLELCNVSDTVICMRPPHEWMGDDFFCIGTDEGNRIGAPWRYIDKWDSQVSDLSPSEKISYDCAWYFTKNSSSFHPLVWQSIPTFLDGGYYIASCVIEPNYSCAFDLHKNLNLVEEDCHRFRLLTLNADEYGGNVQVTHIPEFSPDLLGTEICSSEKISVSFQSEDIPELEKVVGKEVCAHLVYESRPYGTPGPAAFYKTITAYLLKNR